MAPTPPAGGPLRPAWRRGGPPGLAALNCHAFRLAATELQRRHRPRGHSPSAPTAPPELRRAVELAPMNCPIQPRRRCPPPPPERPTRAVSRPTTELAPPKMAGSTLQPHAGRTARRPSWPTTPTPVPQLWNRSSERRAAPFPCEGAARHRVDRRYRFALGASASGSASKTLARDGGCRVNSQDPRVRSVVGEINGNWPSNEVGCPINRASSSNWTGVVPRPIDAPAFRVVCATASTSSERPVENHRSSPPPGLGGGPIVRPRPS
jgi:hypothetical protein